LSTAKQPYRLGFCVYVHVHSKPNFIKKVKHA
jgi:hypothetical protein